MIEFNKEEMREAMKKRVAELQQKLDLKKKQLYDDMNNYAQSLARNKKYKQDKVILDERIIMSQNFIKFVADTFFEMLADQEYLVVTPQATLNEKLKKFSKTVETSMIKITHSINEKQKKSAEEGDRREQQMSQQHPVRQYKSTPKSSRGKNSKLPIQSSLSMVDFLIRNFQNPYPSAEQKQKMKKQGNLDSLDKVNNWFINARQRIIKSYLLTTQKPPRHD